MKGASLPSQSRVLRWMPILPLQRQSRACSSSCACHCPLVWGHMQPALSSACALAQVEQQHGCRSRVGLPRHPGHPGGWQGACAGRRADRRGGRQPARRPQAAGGLGHLSHGWCYAGHAPPLTCTPYTFCARKVHLRAGSVGNDLSSDAASSVARLVHNTPARSCFYQSTCPEPFPLLRCDARAAPGCHAAPPASSPPSSRGGRSEWGAMQPGHK